MKFYIKSDELKKALSKVIDITPKRETLTILDNLYLELKDDSNFLFITAIDSEKNFIKISLPVSKVETGNIFIPARKLFKIMKNIPLTTLGFSVDDKLKITLETQDGGIYESRGNLDYDPPLEPSVTTYYSYHMLASRFKGIINRCSYAVGTDELRKPMTGILFHIKGSELIFVATDGNRMVRIVREGIGDVPDEFSEEYIVPNKLLSILSKFIEDDIRIRFSNENEYVKFLFDDGAMYARLIDEKYPNYTAVIPTDYTKKFTINRETLLSNVKGLMTYSDYTMLFLLSKNQLAISAKDDEMNSEAKRLLLCEYDYDDIEFGFNPKYLVDTLSNLKSKNIIVEFDQPEGVFLFKETEIEKDIEVLMLLAPLRLSCIR